MSDRESEPRWEKFTDSVESDTSGYRALSGLAVVGFLLSLLSVLSLVHVGLSFIAAAAALCCVVALVRISAAPSEYSGRGLAMAGLGLALFWAASGAAKDLTTQRLLDIHSRAVALDWFEFLKKDEPEKALELKASADVRRPLNAKLMDQFRSIPMEYEGLQHFVEQPEVRAILALGDRAQVRRYICEGTDGNSVDQVFAVTYDDQGTKKSFLVEITLVREEIYSHGIAAWRVQHTHGPWTPDRNS